MLKRWDSFTRLLADGRVCLTNNAAERALTASKASGAITTSAPREGIANYSTSLVGQPAHHPFQGEI